MRCPLRVASLLLFLVLALAPRLALAHAVLLETEPSADSVLDVAPDRITFRTVRRGLEPMAAHASLRETRNSRQICLIVLYSWKSARRIFATLSTTSIPHCAPDDHGGIMTIRVKGGRLGSRSPRYGGSWPCRLTHRRETLWRHLHLGPEVWRQARQTR